MVINGIVSYFKNDFIKTLNFVKPAENLKFQRAFLYF